MSFLYPRTVSVQRPGASVPGVGLQAYSAPTVAPVVATGLPASIQLKKEVGTLPASLPGDVSRRTYWNIFVRCALGTVLDRDVIIDDAGVRYQVTGAYWNSLGYACLCERLES